jgi:hypothetical protein
MNELEMIKKNLKMCIKNLTIYLGYDKMQLKLDYNKKMDSLTVKELKENII